MAQTIERNGRTLLTELGVGQFNATMMITQLFVAPATTDPKSPNIILMVKAIQKALNSMGAGVLENGYVDRETAFALSKVAGDRWLSMSWADVITAVLRAKKARMRLDGDTAIEGPTSYYATMGDMPFGLPEVPGGIVTYAVAAFFLYRHFRK